MEKLAEWETELATMNVPKAMSRGLARSATSLRGAFQRKDLLRRGGFIAHLAAARWLAAFDLTTDLRPPFTVRDQSLPAPVHWGNAACS